MADDTPSAIDELLAQYGNTRPERETKTYGPFGEEYGVDYVEPPPLSALLGLRFGFRGMPQAKFPGPWAAEKPPEPRIAREWKQPGDDSVAQHLREAFWGRTREPGEAVARPGSGHWYPFGIPIAKSPIPWLGAGGLGYTTWRALGGPEAWDDLKNNWAAQRARVADKWAGPDAELDERWRQHAIAKRLGLETNWSGPKSLFGPHPEPDDAKRAQAIQDYLTVGGVGNAPY